MSYANPPRLTGSHLAGWLVVVLLHALLAWALVHGLARSVVAVLRSPVEVKIVEAVRAPPAPPAENLPPPPKRWAPPPQVLMPPPEVRLAEPPPASMATAPATTTALTDATPAPLAVAAQIDVGTCDKPEYPPAALRAEARGTSRIRFAVNVNGLLTGATVEQSAGPLREHRLLDAAAIEALSKCRFKPGVDALGHPAGGVTVVEYVWKIH